MRSKIAAVAIGLGVFMIVAAGLVRFYAYPTLATVPADYEGVTELEASGAQVLDYDSTTGAGPLVSETHDLAVTSRTIADPGADAPEGVVVWVNSTTVTRANGVDFQLAQERAAFDAVSGAAVDCAKCESWVRTTAGFGEPVEEEPTERAGQVYKFPFATEKKDYEVWDGAVGKAFPATFEGEEQIDGLTVYKFVQRVDPTVVDTRSLAGEKFGVDAPTVDAEMWYSITRTFYVEPQTGSPVNRVEERTQELRYEDVTVPVFSGTVQYTDDQVAELVEDTKTNATMLGGMKLLFPLLLVVVGLALLAGGLVAGSKARARRHDEADERKTLVNA